jgi:regulator of replication initiation timing
MEPYTKTDTDELQEERMKNTFLHEKIDFTESKVLSQIFELYEAKRTIKTHEETIRYQERESQSRDKYVCEMSRALTESKNENQELRRELDALKRQLAEQEQAKQPQIVHDENSQKIETTRAVCQYFQIDFHVDMASWTFAELKRHINADDESNPKVWEDSFDEFLFVHELGPK